MGFQTLQPWLMVQLCAQCTLIVSIVAFDGKRVAFCSRYIIQDGGWEGGGNLSFQSLKVKK